MLIDTGVQSTLSMQSMLFLGGLGACPPQENLKSIPGERSHDNNLLLYHTKMKMEVLSTPK